MSSLELKGLAFQELLKIETAQKNLTELNKLIQNKMEQLTKQDIAGALYLLITIGFYVMLPGILEMVLIQNIFWYYHLI